MKSYRTQVHSEKEMQTLGARVQRALFPDAFVALYGDLGAGKTEFVRGAAQFLGLTELQSPTFPIVREYETEPPLFHFDAYRLSDDEELYGIGYDDYLRRGGVLMMEWANLVPDALPESRLDITITGSGADVREVQMEPHGAVYEAVLEKL